MLVVSCETWRDAQRLATMCHVCHGIERTPQQIIANALAVRRRARIPFLKDETRGVASILKAAISEPICFNLWLHDMEKQRLYPEDLG